MLPFEPTINGVDLARFIICNSLSLMSLFSPLGKKMMIPIENINTNDLIL
jgi:hypothetical protein